MDLVEHGETEDAADAMNRLEQVERARIFGASLPLDRLLEFANDAVVSAGELEIGLDGAPDDGIGQASGEPFAILLRKQTPVGNGTLY